MRSESDSGRIQMATVSNRDREDPSSTFLAVHVSSSSSSSSPITASDVVVDSYLIDPLVTNSSASNSFQNDGLLSSPPSEPSDSDFGFSRPDFRTSQLVGTVDFYQRHVFLCYKTPHVWPPRIQAADFDRLPRLLSAAVSSKEPLMLKQTRLTICEGRDATETSNGDILIFPDLVRYRRLTHFDVDTFVDEVLVKDGEWLPGAPEKLKGSYIFVCSHGSRDRRCGLCGPALVMKFRDEIESRGLQGKVSVRPCSHIGGHKYAGNVIIFGASIDGEVSGHWYGYVTPDDVPVLLEQHLLKGEIVDWLWRGQMGLSEEEQVRSRQLRFQVNGVTDIGKGTSTKAHLDKDQRTSASCGSEVDAIGCCQGTGNSLCCKTSVLLDQAESYDVDGREAQEMDDKKISKKENSQISSSRETYTRRVCPQSTWFESWEREDTFAALAAVCAAASVAFAYRCYKQLG